MSLSPVLIAGCGDLGTEAGLRFAVAGHPVTGWRRRPELLPAPIRGDRADLTGPLPPLPAGTGTVVIAPAAPGRTEEAYRATYVDGVANVLDAVERDGGDPRIVFVSSTAVYGDAGGGWVDEDTPPAPATATGGVLLEAERRLHDRRPDAVVLRLSGIYGPGRTRLIDQARAGAAAPQRGRITNRIHRDDAAAAIVHLATAVPDPAPLYLGTDHEPAELADVLAFLAGELGVARPASSVDRDPGLGSARPDRLRGTASAPETAGGDGAGAPPSSPRTRGGDRRLSGERLRATGFRFAYPTYREGYRAVLAGHGVRHP